MSEKPQRKADDDPEPIKHSDAERVSGDEGESTGAEEAGGPEELEADPASQ